MAEMKDPRGKRPVAGKQDAVFSHSPDADAAEGTGSPAVLRRGPAKAKKQSWFQKNQVLVISLAAGGVVVAVLVVLAACGLFGSSGPKPVAARPVAPPPQPVSAQQPASSQPARVAAGVGPAGGGSSRTGVSPRRTRGDRLWATRLT